MLIEGTCFVDDIERHTRNAEISRTLFFKDYRRRAFFARKKAFDFRSVQTGGRGDASQMLSLRKIYSFAEVTSEQSLDDGILHAATSREPNEPVGIE